MKFFSFLILYLILTVILPAKDSKPQYFVDAKGGLHLREEPSEKSKSIMLIPDKSEIKFNKDTFYKIDSENPQLNTGYFTMLKPIADDYDKLLETCKRDKKNSALVKPTTIVRKKYTFKINSKRASLYFKGKDISNRGNTE